MKGTMPPAEGGYATIKSASADWNLSPLLGWAGAHWAAGGA